MEQKTKSTKIQKFLCHPEADCELRLEELSLEQAQLAKRKSGTPLQASNQALVSGSHKINPNEIHHRATEPALCNSLVPQCPSALVTSKKVAFTLAEVLITLAIIGVVAAITIPAIIANYQDKVLETAYKKSMSVLSNALNLAIANNGTPGDLRLTPLFSYGLPAYNKQSVSVNVNELDKNSRKLFNIMDSSLSNSFKDKMESITYDDISSILPGDVTLLGNILTPPAYAAVIELPENFQQDIWKSSEYYFVTADGIVYGYLFEKVPDYIRDVGFLVITDVNGQKAPNKAAKDLYLMAVTFSGKVNDFTCYLKNSCTDDDYKRAFGVNKIIGTSDSLGQAGQRPQL